MTRRVGLHAASARRGMTSKLGLSPTAAPLKVSDNRRQPLHLPLMLWTIPALAGTHSWHERAI